MLAILGTEHIAKVRRLSKLFLDFFLFFYFSICSDNWRSVCTGSALYLTIRLRARNLKKKLFHQNYFVKRGINTVFFAKHSALSRYSPLLDIDE